VSEATQGIDRQSRRSHLALRHREISAFVFRFVSRLILADGLCPHRTHPTARVKTSTDVDEERPGARSEVT
jgi:hypothetical protein